MHWRGLLPTTASTSGLRLEIQVCSSSYQEENKQYDLRLDDYYH